VATNKQTKRSRPDGPTTGLFDMYAFLAGHPQFFSEQVEARAKGIRELAGAWRDYMDFVARRLKQDTSLATDLVSEHSPAEKLMVWFRFLETAQIEYTEEAERILSVMAGAASEVSAAAQRQFEETAEFAAEADRRSPAAAE